jgi:hypothetical protein
VHVNLVISKIGSFNLNYFSVEILQNSSVFSCSSTWIERFECRGNFNEIVILNSGSVETLTNYWERERVNRPLSGVT